MVSSIFGPQSSSILAGVPGQATTPSGSTASFTDQLATALEGYLAQSGNNSSLEIDIQATPSQNSGVSQFIVTVKNPASPPAPAPAAAPAPAPGPAPAASSVTPLAAATSGFAASVSPASSSATLATPASTPPSTATQTQQMNEIDAYWAAQPPAVQQLRNVADFGARNALAQQLSDEGYTIDRAIMVWGWDPVQTMQTRKMYGYSWVPSYNQSSVSAAPGFALPGETPYDASNPPPGSIAVNTDFANGLNLGDSSAA